MEIGAGGGCSVVPGSQSLKNAVRGDEAVRLPVGRTGLLMPAGMITQAVSIDDDPTTIFAGNDCVDR
jgi:hypothetical protein